jgi:PAS domain S-box-containing protein
MDPAADLPSFQPIRERSSALAEELTGLVAQLDAARNEPRGLFRRSSGIDSGYPLIEAVGNATQFLTELDPMLERAQQALSELVQQRNQWTALYEISQALTGTLDLEVLLNMVMDDLIEVVHAERGFLMLCEEGSEELDVKVARNLGRETLRAESFQVSRSIIDRVAVERQAILTNNAQRDPRFAANVSVVNYSLRSILCVPLLAKDRLVGVVYVDNRLFTSSFTERDRELLRMFANQAAIAIENARLFNSLNDTIRQVTEIKTEMQNIFNSVAGGVLTIDAEGRLRSYNPAAARMLGLSADGERGRPYPAVFERLEKTELPGLIERVLERGDNYVGNEIEFDLLGHGHVYLSVSLSPLRDENQQPIGATIVMEDLTEHRRLLADQQKEKERYDELLQQVIPIGVALSAERNFEDLLEKIVLEAMSLCDADGGTLYLRTDDDQLQFVIMRNRRLSVALGGTSGREIPFPPIPLYEPGTGSPNYRNVASFTALTGESCNIPDAQALEGFDFSGIRELDEMAGHHLVSLFTCPLKSSEDRIIGVLELFNARHYATDRIIPFDRRLEQTVDALSALAAVALQATEREQRLRRQITELRIEIDEARKAKAVAEITGTDYFEELQRRAKHLRRRVDQDPAD